MKIKKGSDKAHIAPKGAEGNKPHRWLYLVLAAVVVVLVAVIIWFSMFYSNRALPNVAVGKANVGSMQSPAIKSAIEQQKTALSITFDDNNKKTTVAAKDIGVVVDTQATLKNVLNSRNYALWQKVTVPLVLTSDPGKLVEYAKAHFSSMYVNAKEPQIVYDEKDGHFVVKPGENGKGLDIKSFERALPELAKHPENYVMKLTSASVAPLLDEAKLHEAKTEANNRLEKKIEFKLNERVIYTASRNEVANWIYFEPDTTKGTVSIQVDKAKVEQFLKTRVGPTVASPPIDRKVVVDSNTGSQTVLQQGRVGSQIQGIPELTGDVVAAINGGRDFSQNVSIVTAPFKTVTMSGAGKWIEIDLSSQRLTLYVGDTATQSFLVSTGKANTPTRTGEFAIYYKTPVMTMTGTIAGEYYYLPNIKWVSFFDGGEAIHGTYWHHNFGHPMSHGCVNMTEAAAQIVYDFAPVGTKVIVHQ